MNLVKCPRCDLNYIREDEKYCKVCLQEMKGESRSEEIELCSICNEEPCLPGKDVCLFCLREMNKSNSADDTDNGTETENVDTSTIGDMDAVSGMDEIIPDVEEEETDEFGFDTEITELKPLANVCYIDINDLVRCGIRIHHIEHTEQKIHFAYDYFIDVKEQVGPDLYVGYMFGLELEKIDQPFKYKKDQSNKKIKVKLGKVRMQIKDRSEAIRFYLDSYSKQEEDWMSFVYNKASYSLLCADDPVLDSSGNYRRFVFLDEEETVFVAKTKDIRRMDYDIPSV